MNKPIPKFSDEGDERSYWEKQDSAEHIDWSKAKSVVLSNLKPSTKTISLRLPEHLLGMLKILANKRDVPYQSLMKIFLAERVERELSKSNGE